MPDLSFSIEGAEPVPYAATPQLALKIGIENRNPNEQIQSVLLQCQIRIEAARRRYTEAEQERLFDVFGEPERWSQTLRSTLWTHVNVNVRPFLGSTVADVPVPCTFDFNVVAPKYFDALDGGEAPLCVLFSGTVFYQNDGLGLQVAQIPWEKEARYRLPVTVWKQVIERYYPNTAWLALRRDVFDRLQDYKRRNGIATWEQAIEKVLP